MTLTPLIVLQTILSSFPMTIAGSIETEASSVDGNKIYSRPDFGYAAGKVSSFINLSFEIFWVHTHCIMWPVRAFVSFDRTININSSR